MADWTIVQRRGGRQIGRRYFGRGAQDNYGAGGLLVSEGDITTSLGSAGQQWAAVQTVVDVLEICMGWYI